MYRSNIFLACTLATLVISCSTNMKNSCSTLWSDYKNVVIKLEKSKPSPSGRIKSRTFSDIKNCYRESPYLNDYRRIEFDEERILDDGRIALLFGIDGVQDIQLVVVIDGNEEISSIGLGTLNF